MSILGQLNPRERVLVLGGTALLLVLGLWSYIWQPMVAERGVQADRIARYLAVAQIAKNAGGVASLAVRSPVSDVPLAPRITQSAESADIPLARLDPDGPRLRITVAKGSYDVLIAWIAALEATQNVRSLSIEMSRLTEPGQVSLRLMVEDAG